MEDIDKLKIDDITQLRKKIDVIDKKILEYLAKRLELAKSIAKEKQKVGLSIIDKERERQLRELWDAHAKKLGLNIKNISKIFDVILDISKQTQNNVKK